MANVTPTNPLGSGRQTKLTPEIIEEACKVLRVGTYVKTACGYLGISENAWYRWIKNAKKAMNKNEEDLTDTEKLEIEFTHATQKALDEAVIRNMQLIQNAATSNWQAAAWTLERRYPDMYSLVQRITVNSQPEQLTPDIIRQHLEERKATTIDVEAKVTPE